MATYYWTKIGSSYVEYMFQPGNDRALRNSGGLGISGVTTWLSRQEAVRQVREKVAKGFTVKKIEGKVRPTLDEWERA